jgi:ribonucleotide monophosphatase NagD (HAD superfamily)
VGKPEPGLFRAAAEAVGLAVADAVVIGDGLGTDILAAQRVGARSVLMLTGVSTREHLAALPASERPTRVAQDARELDAILDQLAA